MPEHATIGQFEGMILTAIVSLGENAYGVTIHQAVRDLAAIGGNGLVCFDAEALVRKSNIDAERVLRFALCDVDPSGWLVDIVEKPGPDHPLARRPERLVSMNLWSFTPDIFEACRRTTPDLSPPSRETDMA